MQNYTMNKIDPQHYEVTLADGTVIGEVVQPKGEYGRWQFIQGEQESICYDRRTQAAAALYAAYQAK